MQRQNDDTLVGNDDNEAVEGAHAIKFEFLFFGTIYAADLDSSDEDQAGF